MKSKWSKDDEQKVRSAKKKKSISKKIRTLLITEKFEKRVREVVEEDATAEVNCNKQRDASAREAAVNTPINRRGGVKKREVSVGNDRVTTFSRLQTSSTSATHEN